MYNNNKTHKDADSHTHVISMSHRVKRAGRLSPPEAMLRPPCKTGFPHFFIIMHPKCCADRWHDLPVFHNHYETNILFLVYFGSQINEYYDDTNNIRMEDWQAIKMNLLELQQCDCEKNNWGRGWQICGKAPRRWGLGRALPPIGVRPGEGAVPTPQNFF